jgi:hypothetical protein
MMMMKRCIVGWLAAVQSGLSAAANSPCNMFRHPHLHVTAIQLFDWQNLLLLLLSVLRGELAGSEQPRFC